jgi:hypothetical protein
MKYDDPDLRDALAAEYALGTLRGAARRRFERLLAKDPALGRRVEWWEQQLNELGGGLPPVAPPPGLKQAIESRLDNEPIQGGYVLRRDEGEWAPFAHGIERKILSEGPGGASSALYRMAAGTAFELHEHELDEECYVIDGEIDVGGVTFRAGDYLFVGRGGTHKPLRSRTGALLFIRGET